MRLKRLIITAAVLSATLGVTGFTTAPAWQPPYVGAAAAGEPPYDFGEEWDDAQREIGGGRLTYRRSFDPTTPEVGRENWRAADAPNTFYSVKPPGGDHLGMAEGKYDEPLRAVVRALPKGTKFTERGITADHGEAARLEILRADWAFVNRMGAEIFLYWQSPRDDSWPLTTPAEQRTYREFARMGRQ